MKDTVSKETMAFSTVLRRALPFLLLTLLAVLAWGRTVGHDFVWDDHYFVVVNPALRSSTYIPAYFSDAGTMAGEGRAHDVEIVGPWRPFRNISYRMDWAIAGLDARWWHLHNIFLHLVNACLVFLLAGAFFKRAGPAFVVGAIFLLHPVQSEVVAWVKCRDDLLAAFFSLVFLLLWTRWRSCESRPLRLTVLGLLYFAACLSKESAIVLPLLVLAIEMWPGVLPSSGARRVPVGLMIVLGIAGGFFLLWRHAVLGYTGQAGYIEGDFLVRMMTMTRVGVRYLQLLLVPSGLLADYIGYDPSTSLADPRVWSASIMLLVLAAAVWVGRRALPVETLGVVWMVIGLLTVSNVVPMMQFLAERFLYFPLIGFALTAGALFDRAVSRYPRSTWSVAALLLALYTMASAIRADVWKDNITLHRVTVRDTPPSSIRPRRNLLSALLNAGLYEEALPLATELWQSSRDNLSVPQRFRAEYARHLGTIHIVLGRVDEGAELLVAALEMDPSYPAVYGDLGMLDGQGGRHQEALEWFERGLAVSPGDAALLYNRGIALEQLGRDREAEEALRQAVKAHTGKPNAAKALAAMLWKQGRFADAAEVYSEAIPFWPRDAELGHWHAEALRLATAQGSP